jgi:hypothetical protein
MKKSGENLHLTPMGETYDAMYVGSVVAEDTGQKSLIDDIVTAGTAPANGTIPCWQVLVQADPGNSANILVGNEHQGCRIVLRAGESITIPVNRVEKVFVISLAAGGDQTVNWLAMT